MSTNSYDISIIIVSWNVRDFLDQCLQSIVPCMTRVNIEVIVVDNCSLDGSIGMVKRKYPWVKILENSYNIGFARANNLGLNLATGKNILFLNPDTVLEKDTLQILKGTLDGNKKIGIVGPKLIYPNGLTQNVCARKIPTLFARILIIKLRAKRIPFLGERITKNMFYPYSYQISQRVEAISGAAMLVRSEIIMRLGGFGENYIHTGEDLDLCFRVHKEGWDVFYNADTSIIHYHGKSSDQAIVRVYINTEISQQIFFSCCYGNFHGYLYRLLINIIDIPYIAIIGVIKFILKKESNVQLKNRFAIIKGIVSWKPVWDI